MPVEKSEMMAEPEVMSPEDAPGLEVLEDGSVIVTVPDDLLEEATGTPTLQHFDNLVETLSEDDLTALGNTVVEEFEADKMSRSEWESSFEKGFELLGIKLEEKSDPFLGACSATNTLIIENAIKFQSKASPELLPPGGPVKTQIVGSQTPDKEEQAERVKAFMNFQTTEQMPEYFDETEKLLFYTAITGSGFKKIYYCAKQERPVVEFTPVSDIYVPYSASDLRTADRITHVIYRTPRQLEDDMDSGFYLKCTLQEAPQANPGGMRQKIDSIIGLAPAAAHNEQYVLLEQQRYMKLDGDERQMPYIVTVESDSKKVLAVRRNWDEETKKKIEHFVHYPFVRGFGFYGLGYIHLLGNLTMASTLAMRALVDSGQFSNLQGGFKAKGIKIIGDNDPIAPGTWKEVEATGMDLTKAIIPLPFKEPSQTLYQMLDYMDRKGQKFADSTEAVIADSTNYGPVGTTLALLEGASKFYNAIHKRMHKAAREEFKILAEINYRWLPENYPYDTAGESRQVLREDFDGRVDIIPVSDPNIPTSAHRLTLAQLLLQLTTQAPAGTYNVMEVHKTILRSAGFQNIDRVLNEKVEPKAQDPIGDIASCVAGQPVRAFPGQDHQAHIAVESAWLQDPVNGANPLMAGAAQALTAHIKDHMMSLYAEQMQGMQQQGIEAKDAAQQILKYNASKRITDIEEASIQLQRDEIELRKKEVGLRAARDAANIVLKQNDQDLKRNELELKGATELARMAHDSNEAEKDREQKTVNAAISSLQKLSKPPKEG